MPVQRSRDDHIWRLTATNAVTRMAIHDSLHDNYMFFHMNFNELPTNFSSIFPPFCECLGTFSRFPIRQKWFFNLFPKRSVFLILSALGRLLGAAATSLPKPSPCAATAASSSPDYQPHPAQKRGHPGYGH